ncbi:MAG: hypothetical protein HY905_07135 [Deltaproteobacteria bacterium]|nr:hypothetical protein [Deltaproteobacteria bacterium]
MSEHAVTFPRRPGSPSPVTLRTILTILLALLPGTTSSTSSACANVPTAAQLILSCSASRVRCQSHSTNAPRVASSG